MVSSLVLAIASPIIIKSLTFSSLFISQNTTYKASFWAPPLATILDTNSCSRSGLVSKAELSKSQFKTGELQFRQTTILRAKHSYFPFSSKILFTVFKASLKIVFNWVIGFDIETVPSIAITILDSFSSETILKAFSLKTLAKKVYSLIPYSI